MRLGLGLTIASPAVLPGRAVPPADYEWNASGLALPSWLTCTRASTANVFDATGVLTSIAINEPKFTRTPFGMMLLREVARTNIIIQNRDATNAAWVKTNCTAARNQVGIDGAANTASLITATAANGACLQTRTATVATRTFSVFMKRVTGAGAIEITQDNFATTQNVASQLSMAEWRPVQITGSVTNPVSGLRIATSGDAVAIDYAQSEIGSDATSPIPTTTVSVTRSADTYTIGGAALIILQSGVWTICIDAYETTVANTTGLVNNSIINIDTSGVVNSGALVAGTVTPGLVFRVAVSNGVSSRAVSMNGGDAASDPTPFVVPAAAFLNNGNIYGARFRIWSRTFSNAELKSISTL